MKNKIGITSFMVRISCIEIIFGILFVVFGLVKDKFDFENLFLMIGIGFFVGAGFTFIIGVMAGSITQHKKLEK